MKKPLILIDLDGVLNSYKGDYKENHIPKPQKGVWEFLEDLSKNYIIKIFTTRKKNLVEPWLKKHNLDKYINDITNVKEPAFLYVDDRSITYSGDYKELQRAIIDFKPHWKLKQNNDNRA